MKSKKPQWVNNNLLYLILLVSFTCIGVFIHIFFYSSLISFSVVDSKQSLSSCENLGKERNIENGQTIQCQFTAKTNNLGIVGFSFDEDRSTLFNDFYFRIKEVDQDNWFYESTYNSRNFKNNDPFTFGFPIVSESQNKEYLVELENKRSEDQNIFYFTDNPFFYSFYKFSINDIVSNPLYFFINKFFLNTPGISLFAIVLYLLPLLLFISTKYFNLHIKPLFLEVVTIVLFFTLLFHMFVPEKILFPLSYIFIVTVVAYTLIKRDSMGELQEDITEKRVGNKLAYLILLFIVLFGLLLRLENINNDFHGDEFQVIGTAAGYMHSGEFKQWDWKNNTLCQSCDYDRAWPHTWMIAESFRLFGISEWSSRIPSIFFGIVYPS